MKGLIFSIEREEWEAVIPAGDLPQPMGNHSCVSYGDKFDSFFRRK